LQTIIVIQLFLVKTKLACTVCCTGSNRENEKDKHNKENSWGANHNNKVENIGDVRKDFPEIGQIRGFTIAGADFRGTFEPKSVQICP
jgi:hypothetical protein